MTERKVLLSGIQPTGELHIGNYFGAMRQFVEHQTIYDSYISIVNFHALTTVQDSKLLQNNTFNAVVDHLAIGLEPGILFLQSDVPEVTELAWIFNTLVTVPYLERSVAYKDKIAQGIAPNVGLFDYPVLQAADILIMNADCVPVGADQKQHIEYARDIASKFNNTFSQTFTTPEPMILDTVAVVPGLDGKKMSKSYGNTIPLFAADDVIEKKVMSIVTDSKRPEEPKTADGETTFELHKLFADEHMLANLREGYEKGGLSYAESKKLLAEEIKTFIAPLREKRNLIAEDRESVLKILKNGADRARDKAQLTMKAVRNVTGLSL